MNNTIKDVIQHHIDDITARLVEYEKTLERLRKEIAENEQYVETLNKKRTDLTAALAVLAKV